MIGADTRELGWRLTTESGARQAERRSTIAASTPQKNHLLAALPPEVQARLFARLTPVSLRQGQTLYDCGAVQRDVYFPIDSVMALLCLNEDGSSAEVAVVGNEGLIGLPSFMGGQSSPFGVVVECAGLAYRLSGDSLMAEFGRHPEVLSLMLRYTQALIAQISQTAVCNRHHSIDQQLCRCLLRCLDRLPSPEITLTHVLMASMLGVRREGVTAAAGKLKKLGLIRYSRGRITVPDRRRLEDLACECYAAVKAESDRLLPCLSTPSQRLVA